jgi:hypothetical protein
MRCSGGPASIAEWLLLAQSGRSNATDSHGVALGLAALSKNRMLKSRNWAPTNCWKDVCL